MKPRSAKAKGTKLEKKVMDFFNKIPGWCARKQPGSGIYSDFPHDVHATHETLGGFITECKKWKHGWRTGDKAMGKADFLVIERDYGAPMIYMSLDTFRLFADRETEAPAEPSRPLSHPTLKRKFDGQVVPR